MTTNFPTSVDSFPDPLATDRLDNPPHDVLHTNVNSAVEAIETALLDGAPLHIDDANERVGIGTTTPESALEVNGVLTANHIHGNIAGAVYLHVKNTSGVTIPAGSPVYATGSVGASGATEVAISDADVVSTMPALGIVDSELVANAEGHATVLGVAKGLDTSAWSVNDSLYVSTSGGLTNVRPTGASELVQKIGRVIRADASTGEVLVLGAGRSNDVPNNIVAGGLTIDTDTLHVDSANDRVGIGTTSPDRTLHVDSGGVGIAATFQSSLATGGISLMGSGTTDDTRVRIGAEGDDLKLFSSNVERMRINSSGNVGIGDSTPSYKLDVNGDIRAIGDIRSEGPDGGMIMRTWTGNSAFGMIGTSNMSGSEYSLLTDGTNTYISGGSGGTVYLRGGANDTNPQFSVSTTEVQITQDVSGSLGAQLWLRNGVSATNTAAAITFEVDASTDTTAPNGQIKVVNANGANSDSVMLFNIWNGSSFVETVKVARAYGYGASGWAFANAAVALDRGWANYPSLTVFNNPSTTEFRIHGANTYYGSYPGSSGSDFSVNLRIDGATYYSSDSRHKTNIVDNPYGLNAINQLQPRKFDRLNSDGNIEDHATDILGFIAQEVMEVIPEAVTYYADEDTPNENGWCRSYSLSESYIVSTLVNAVKELSAQNDALTARIEALEAAEVVESSPETDVDTLEAP